MTTAAPRVRRVEGLLPERTVLGLTLLAIGAIILAASVVPGVDRYTLLGVSAATLVAFASTREYGFAIPAGITGGLGTMVLAARRAAVRSHDDGARVLPVPRRRIRRDLGPRAHRAAARDAARGRSRRRPSSARSGSCSAAGQPAAFDWIQVGVASILVDRRGRDAHPSTAQH